MENEQSATEASQTTDQSFETALTEATQSYQTDKASLTPPFKPEASAVDKPSDASQPVKVDPEKQKTIDENVKRTNEERERRQHNKAQAEKRLSRTNEKLRNQIAELQKQVEELSKQQQTPQIQYEQQRLTDKADTLQTIVSNSEAEDFENFASEYIPAEKLGDFMQLTYNYAEYVNNHEPELLSYASREGGPIVLNQWYNKMNDPKFRQTWAHMTAYEKGKELDRFYVQVQQYLRGELRPTQQNGHQAPTTKQPANIPTPTGGRNTQVAPSTDDFGIALTEAMNKFGRK